MYDDTIVELEGANGEWFTLAGPNAGDRGMYLGDKGLKGLFEPTAKVTYEEPGNFPGSRYLSHRLLARNIKLPILIEAMGDTWSGIDSDLRRALSFKKDAYIHVTTPESGHRKLAFRLGGPDSSTPAVDVNLDIDPHMDEDAQAMVTAIAGDPLYYGDDEVYSAVTRTDTRFQPTIFDGIFPWEKLPKEDLYITVDPSDGRGGLNPTDQDIYLKWSVPASEEHVPTLPWPFPPNVVIPWDKAPFTQWVLPDYSFPNDDLFDPKQENRRLKLPGLIIGENCVIDTDPRVEQVTSESGSQVWARMNGVRFRNPVPPYTKSRTFKISVSGCAPGQMVTLRIPRPWSRPWGLEA